MRKAKILATLGPASNNQPIIETMIRAGLNAVRINMSHGTQNEHSQTIANARAAAAAVDMPLSILVDLSGPKIRTGKLIKGASVVLHEGDLFTITTREIEGDGHTVGTNYDGLPTVVETGARILIDDGAIELIVDSTTETDVNCRVIVGGVLSERKGINLPNTTLPIPSMTSKDHADLECAMMQTVDYIALSFVRTADDCREAKDKIKSLNKRKLGRPLLVAKIEKAEAIANLVITQWLPHQAIHLSRNEFYYRQDEGLPYLDSLTFRFIGNSEQLFALLLSGECHIGLQDGLDLSQATLLQEAETRGLLQPYFQTTTVFEHLDFGINPDEVYASKRPDWFEATQARQAVAQCIDRQALVDTVLVGLGQVSDLFVPPDYPLIPADLNGWEYDPAAANLLLDDLGYTDLNGDGIRQYPFHIKPFRVTLGITQNNPTLKIVV